MGWGFLAPLIAPIADVFKARVVRKAAKDSIKGKSALASLDAETQITLTDAEWEVVKAANETESWKDEYVTLVVTAPVVLIIVGSAYAAFTGNVELLNGAVAGIDALNQVGIPMPELMTATVYAALGLKLWRSK